MFILVREGFSFSEVMSPDSVTFGAKPLLRMARWPNFAKCGGADHTARRPQTNGPLRRPPSQRAAAPPRQQKFVNRGRQYATRAPSVPRRPTSKRNGCPVALERHVFGSKALARLGMPTGFSSHASSSFESHLIK